MKMSAWLLGALAWSIALPALGDLGVGLLSPNSPPRDLNSFHGGIQGLDPWTAKGTLARACYAFPHYVVWAMEDIHIEKDKFGTKIVDNGASFQVGAAKSNAEADALCQKVANPNDPRFEGYFKGLSGDYAFSGNFKSHGPHKSAMEIFELKTKKKFRMLEYIYDYPIKIEGTHLTYWKADGTVILKDCPELNDRDLPPKLPLILSRHMDLDLTTLQERPLPETRCTDPRLELID